jgi:hypothetical protein
MKPGNEHLVLAGIAECTMIEAEMRCRFTCASNSKPLAMRLEEHPLKQLVPLTWIFIIILIYKSVRRYGDERWKKQQRQFYKVML